MVLTDDPFAMSREELMRSKLLLALMHMTENAHLDDISVADICRQAGVSRQTFYRYFKDKFDVLHWMWDEIFEKAHAAGAQTNGDWRLAQIVYLETFLDACSTYISGHRHGIESLDYNSMFCHACRRRTHDLKELVRMRAGREPTDFECRSIDFFVNGESRAITAWFVCGPTLTARQTAEEIIANMPAPLCAALDAGVAPEPPSSQG